MATRAHHLANVVVSQLNTVLGMAGSFVVTPAILYGLGDSSYGGWLLINSFVQYMRFLDMGMSIGTMKYGAAAVEREDDKALGRVLDTSSAIFCVMGTIGVIAAVGLTQLLPRLYPVVASGQGIAILALGCAISLDLLFRPFSATLRMRSLFFIHDGIEFLTYSIFKLGLLLHFAYSGRLSYKTLALLTLAETVTRVLLVAGISLVRFPSSRRMNPFRVERDMLRSLAGMGAMWTIITVAEIVRFQLDAGVIGYFMPESPINISIFGVGTRLPSIAYTSIGVIGGVLMPKFSGLSATGDTKEVLRLLRQASVSTALVASLVLVNLAVMGPQFLELWLHKPWVASSGRILLMMLPGYFIALLAGPASNLLLGRAQLRGLATLTVVEALTNFTLSVALVRPFGIWGVGLGTVIPLAFFRGVVFPWLLNREIGIKPSQYFAMQGRGVGVGALYLVLLSPLSLVAIPSYTRFILLCIASVTVFAVVVLGLVPEARAGLRRQIRRRLGRGGDDEDRDEGDAPAESASKEAS